MLSFKNVNVYLNNKKIVKTNLSIKNGKFSFSKCKEAKTLPSKYIIVPGFIEEHIHGANNSDVMDSSPKALRNISRALLQDGVTSWCPTTMTMPKTQIVKALKNIASKQHNFDEAKIVGINLEGPFICKEKKGAQDDKYIIKPNIKDLDAFIKASRNKIKIITIAIEKCPSSFIQYLKRKNIVVSVGHSMANGNNLIKSYQAGLGCVTHTYNAMQKVVDKKIGIIGQLLLHKDIYAELILDLKHVSKKQALALKKHDRLILITDSNKGRFMPDGKYRLGTNDIFVRNGVSLTKTGQLAGSVLTIPQALKNAKKVFKYSFKRCIDLVCKNPANNLHLHDCGIIKNGNSADFVIIDKNFNVYQTFVNGKLVYSKGKLLSKELNYD